MTLHKRSVLFVAAVSVALATSLPVRASELDAQTLAHAQVIRSEINARSRSLPGTRLRVTEASPTGVVDSLTLVDDLRELPRVVSARNGIYFAICTVRSHCPYPARSSSLAATAPAPRRLALELALRTFEETAAALVVVSLPTTRLTWLVFERDDFDRAAGVFAMDADFVEGLTLPRLFVPIPVLPPTHETIIAASFELLGP
jgi:hypothetical protein